MASSVYACINKWKSLKDLTIYKKDTYPSEITSELRAKTNFKWTFMYIFCWAKSSSWKYNFSFIEFQ